jgi:hypothetical protein
VFTDGDFKRGRSSLKIFIVTDMRRDCTVISVKLKFEINTASSKYRDLGYFASQAVFSSHSLCPPNHLYRRAFCHLVIESSAAERFGADPIWLDFEIITPAFHAV